MSNRSWLQLTDYSNKYDISISTLRRRIKEESIDFKLDAGKYFLMDEPLNKKPRGRKPVEDRRKDFMNEGSFIGSTVYFDSEDVQPVGTRVKTSKTRATTNPPVLTGSNGGDSQVLNEKSEPIFSAANRLLEELKKAYSQILQEKEEQALLLKEEIADLRTLTQVLESENERLRKKLNE